jgi:hypothetical protein
MKDVLCGILSKLPAEEVVRTSVLLSSEWRCLWTGYPKLSFNGRTMCAGAGKQDTQMFIHCVNAVLRQHRGKGVVGLEVKSLFENKLIDHLNNWISFAMFSRTKSLVIWHRQNSWDLMICTYCLLTLRKGKCILSAVSST